MIRNAFLQSMLLSVLFISGLRPVAAADAYPSRPVRIIVPYSAGSTGDTVIRVLAPKLEAALNAKVIVEYKPGAGGNIGSRYVAVARPDGYTILMTAVNSFSMNQFIYRSMPYDPAKDFSPISKVVDLPYVMYASNQVPAKDLKSFISYAKARPGKLFFASSGAGTAPHLAGLLFDRLAGVQMEHVAYTGNGESIRAMMANEVQIYFASVSAGQGHIGQGDHKMHVLTTAWPTRLSEYPDVPSAVESGLPDLKVSNWWGLAAPAGTPRPSIEKLASAVATALRDPSVQQKLTQLGMLPAAETPSKFEADIKADTIRWGNLIKASGIKPQ